MSNYSYSVPEIISLNSLLFEVSDLLSFLMAGKADYFVFRIEN